MGRGGIGTAAIAIWALLGAAGLAQAQVVRQVTDTRTTIAGPGALDDAGAWVYTGTTADLLGTNPEHRFRIVRFDAATGVAEELFSHPDGVAATVSVSDDGQWLAFTSPADLTGQNHDQSAELFVMRADGTGLAQLTDDPAVNAGSVGSVALSGSANRIVFTANTDPLGTNPGHLTQLFAIDRDGSNLIQLTAFAAGSVGAIGISDDGARIVFGHAGDPLGQNADLGGEVFAIDADGTNLRQLSVTPAGFDSGAPSIAGGGSKVAFQSNGDLTGANPDNQVEIFAIDWAGTGLAQVTATRSLLGFTGDPASQAPAITDDGLKVFFHSNHNTLFVNFDANFEIFSINTNGTGLAAVTSTILNTGSLLPAIAGNGSRVAYFSIDDTANLRVATGTGANVRLLVAFDVQFNTAPAISPDGSRVVFLRATGLLTPTQLWRVQSDGSDPVQLTNLASGGAAGPSIAGDGDTIVFSADSNPTGGNSDLSEEIFRIQADGTGLVRLTSGAPGTASTNPAISSDGAWVVFDSDADLLGTNADGSREVFAMRADGSDLRQLTGAPAGTSSRAPRADAGAAWIVFESNADLDLGNPDGTYEIFRVRIDGSGLERLTGDPALGSRSPDISGGGDRIVFRSESDPAGANPELNGEIFLWDAGTTAITQLTVTAEGASSAPRLSPDGQWAWFVSTSPFLEDDPDGPLDLYRMPAAGGPVERIGALRAGAPGGAAPDEPGATGVFSGAGDFTGGNPDLLNELWVIDRLAAPRLEVGRDAPTVLRWSHESGPLRYDAIRGDVAALGSNPDLSVDLGAVVCLEDDSPDADTEGFGDVEQPAPGQAFFFLTRGTQGLLAGPGSYGAGSGGGERNAASGDCDP